MPMIGARKPLEQMAAKAKPAKSTEEKLSGFATADASKWVVEDFAFSGSYTFVTMGSKEVVEGEITEGIAKFEADPAQYVAMQYQTAMVDWPVDQQKYTLISRAGTKGYMPTGCAPDGWMTAKINKFQALEPNVDLSAIKDSVTDDFAYQGHLLHHDKNVPLCPGRGQGCADIPGLKIIGDVDPSDIAQGAVGDCWLLSAISALAEFDGAIKKLFVKTEGLDEMPRDTPNVYTITLYDLTTWEPVDVTVDERLCAKAAGGGLLGCHPSVDGELWVCYLEKAVAAHCGGWDEINGGECTHAWSLLTGCKEQYTIRRDKESGKFTCMGKKNANTDTWEEHANSPHQGFRGLWPMAWPELGGGGEYSARLDENELFERMCAWDDADYIMGCGTKAGSDSETTDGIVDGHAYSVLRCVNDVAGTEHDLIKVRNPWGKGEFESGMWDDDGPGWDQFPEVKAELQPVMRDDGVFWVSKQEFFKHFGTIYLSAKSMTEFLED